MEMSTQTSCVKEKGVNFKILTPRVTTSKEVTTNLLSQDKEEKGEQSEKRFHVADKCMQTSWMEYTVIVWQAKHQRKGCDCHMPYL